MINVSKRLLAISKYIESEDKVIDIGCDHALLDIYLVQNNKIGNIIASDIIQNAIDSAKKNIDKHNLSNIINLRCGDGLKVLNDKDSIDTIIISGMGYQKVLKIFEESKDVLTSINKIIIQSNTLPSIIKKYLTKNNYYISDEELIKDNNIIYTIIIFKKGKKKYNSRELKFGPCLIKNKNELFYEMIDIEINKNNMLLKLIPKKYFIKRYKLKKEIKILLNEKKS